MSKRCVLAQDSVNVMPDHYHGFSHPVLDLVPKAVTHLFAEFNQIADKLRSHPRHVAADDEIAFRQLQQRRRPDLSDAQCLDLISEWRDAYQTRLDLKTAETRARVAELLRKRDALFTERASASPDAISRIDARLRDIGNEIAASFEARDCLAVATLR